MEELQDFVVVILQTVITIAVPILTAYVVRWLNSLKLDVLARISQSRYESIKFLVETAVKAAEQAGLAEYIQNTAAAKKSFAVVRLQAMLEARGLGYISVAEIEAHIEAAILRGWQSADVELLDFGQPTTGAPRLEKRTIETNDLGALKAGTINRT
jgi:hypothetical protein